MLSSVLITLSSNFHCYEEVNAWCKETTEQNYTAVCQRDYADYTSLVADYYISQLLFPSVFSRHNLLIFSLIVTNMWLVTFSVWLLLTSVMFVLLPDYGPSDLQLVV